MTGFKILTHDWRSPIQGGQPVCNGELPTTLPRVHLDTSDNECGAGWNFCHTLATAAKIAGFWPTGRPARCLVVEADDAIERGDKIRAAELRVVRLATDNEIKGAMRDLVVSWVGDANVESLTDEQWAWYVALGRPKRNVAQVERGLREALAIRSLNWKIKQVPDAGAAWDAGVARAAWAEWAAWDARAAWAARDAWDAWDAWAAKDALSLYSAVVAGWLSNYKAEHLTVGIRSAYYYGLGDVAPIAKGVLGYSMDRS